MMNMISNYDIVDAVKYFGKNYQVSLNNRGHITLTSIYAINQPIGSYKHKPVYTIYKRKNEYGLTVYSIRKHSSNHNSSIMFKNDNFYTLYALYQRFTKYMVNYPNYAVYGVLK